MEDTFELETWLIELGDAIIRKEDASGPGSLSLAESAVFDLWAVDYAVRNAGHMIALEGLRPEAAHDLAKFLRTKGQVELAAFVTDLADAGEDCEMYYGRFVELCRALQRELPVAGHALPSEPGSAD